MNYLYLVLGIICLLMSGMWLGSIFTDNAIGNTITITQYFMVIFMFVIGLFQFYMLYQKLVLE